MKLSVIILNYNVRYFLELCLKSVQDAITTIDAEIIVVDNNSKDGSCKMVREQFPDVFLIENKENFGFSKGNNIGVKQAHGQYVCILNPDTVVSEDTFTQLIEFAERKTDLGILGCQLIDGKGRFLPESKRNIPTPSVAFKKILGYSKPYYSALNQNAIGSVPILVGAFMLLRRDLYNLVGGFDEDYFLYGEDIDLSYKILKKGYRNYYYGKSSVLHFKGESTLKDKRYTKRFYGAMEIFYKKHFKTIPVFNVLIFLGIKLASNFRMQSKSIATDYTQTILFSEQGFKTLKTQLPKPVIQKIERDEIAPKSLVVFDSELLNFKTIIETMQLNAEKEKISFRIIPKNSNFSLGSDTTITRGEVLKF